MGWKFGFMNGVDDRDFPVLTTPSTHPQLVWTYVGGLHFNRWKPLLLLARSITSRGGLLNIFAPAPDVREHGQRFMGLPGCRVGSPAADAMEPMRKAMSSCT